MSEVKLTWNGLDFYYDNNQSGVIWRKNKKGEYIGKVLFYSEKPCTIVHARLTGITLDTPPQEDQRTQLNQSPPKG